MNAMDSQALLKNLVADLKPIPWHRRPWVLALAWASFSLVYFGFIIEKVLGLSFTKISDLDPASLAFVGVLAGIFISGSVLTLAGSLPGRLRRDFWWWLPLILSLVWVAAMGFLHPLSPPPPHPSFGYLSEDFFCSKDIFIISLLPTLVLILIARTLAPTQPRRVATALMFTSGGGAALCMELFCPDRSFVHRLYGHWGMVFLLALIGWTAGRRILKW